MADRRWSSELEAAAAEAFEAWATSREDPDDLWSKPRAAARAVLTAAADAGALLPPGGETTDQLAVQTTHLRYPVDDLPAAWRKYGELKAQGHDPVQILRRTVYIGPEREVAQ